MIRLVALDIDDTLMDSKGNIPQANLEAIDRVRRQGVEVVLVTGRMHCRALPYARMLKLDPEQVLISYNGAMLRKISGEEIAHIPLEHHTALELIEYFQNRNRTVQIYHDDQLYVAEIDANVEYYMRMSGAEARPVGDLYRFAADQSKALSKLLVVGSEEEVAEEISLAQIRFGSIVQVVQSKKRYIEITHLDATKGKALAYLAGRLGYRREEVMAVGDGGNDLGMIEWAGVGVAVGNAPEHVKAAADFVTKTHDEAGVAYALDRFV
ncbi:MAG: Cof-type HAD-IIB family hydrolase [Limnochordia bacterium]|jgi:Cof subfamily protein (haloacid dehalogenase superfamily)|nr:Cof-type HAD-IIB family hydrolase [Bacillota bacterium]HOB08967.1 Cof-type HAD-IIB family hydrolase [Limnochordia bacterium]NLH30748.1 HAD family phosphatase [Bacillota bacterium]HPT92834.1 Cof-type HAD-IIB family hydrolase [Limnochordia bacterium]HPZ31125.1 Cof-type HAD-IIB family hydrolase [Limnochordia bacterium]